MASLIDHVMKVWIISLFREWFLEHDVKLIAKILVAIDFDDQWIWKGDFHGLYSVKHDYRLLMCEVNNPVLVFTA